MPVHFGTKLSSFLLLGTSLPAPGTKLCVCGLLLLVSLISGQAGSGGGSGQ